MRVLDAKAVEVEYGQIYVTSGDTTWSDTVGTIGGQHNGPCGAGWPGALLLVAGLRTGQVLFTVNVEDSAPPVDNSWEEIVEVSYVPGNNMAWPR